METVVIAGVGLIGGSFGLALKKAGFQGRIIGVSSAATIEAARAAGAIDEAMSLRDAAGVADLIYLAQPIGRILQTLPELNPWVRPETLVTDAGSTKGAIVARANEALTRCTFLGGHPLAGKERRGVKHADPDLFRGRLYVLTPRAESDLEAGAAAGFLEWLRRIGARPLVTTPDQHDSVVAYTSHLPQLTATALASCLGAELGTGFAPIWGPALVDSTRLALSAYEIWGDILHTNRDAIDGALAAYIGKLQKMRDLLGGPDMKRLFNDGAEFARRVRE